jgi:hypothetical protein
MPNEFTSAGRAFGYRAQRIMRISNNLASLLNKLVASNEFNDFLLVWEFGTNTTLCHFVDSFLRYLVDILSEILKSRPDALKSSEKVDIEDVLRCSSMEDVIHFLAERKVNALSYKSVAEVLDYFTKNLGLAVLTNTQERDNLILAVEVRNLFTHNDGVINERFRNKAPGGPYPLKHRLSNSGAWVRLGVSFAYLVFDIDVAAATKFNLPTSIAPTDWNKSFDIGPQNV